MHFSYTSLLSAACLFQSSIAVNDDFNYYHRHQQQRLSTAAAAKARQQSLGAEKTDYQFRNDKTSPYFIDSWPDIDFDTGEMYSGTVCSTNQKEGFYRVCADRACKGANQRVGPITQPVLHLHSCREAYQYSHHLVERRSRLQFAGRFLSCVSHTQPPPNI